MRYNKDFIAETLAEAAQDANQETRPADPRGLAKRSGLESMQVHNFRESSSEQAEAKRLHVHKRIMSSITGSAIVWLILLFVFPAATLAQSS